MSNTQTATRSTYMTAIDERGYNEPNDLEVHSFISKTNIDTTWE